VVTRSWLGDPNHGPPAPGEESGWEETAMLPMLLMRYRHILEVPSVSGHHSTKLCNISYPLYGLPL